MSACSLPVCGLLRVPSNRSFPGIWMSISIRSKRVPRSLLTASSPFVTLLRGMAETFEQLEASFPA